MRGIKNTLEALTQSAGVYALCALVYAFAVAIPLNATNARVLAGMSAYTGVVFVFVAVGPPFYACSARKLMCFS